MQTLSLYDKYISLNLAPIRKALEKRMNNASSMSSEGKKRLPDDLSLIAHFCFVELLSIPPKQFLQILSQVQVRTIRLSPTFSH